MQDFSFLGWGHGEGMWIILKVFTEFCYNIASVLFYVLIFGHKACGVLAP